jgi:AraC-like DNA-binding protein
MQAERDYLRTQLLPEVNDILREYAIKLRLIDLRWGINTLESNECTVEEKVLQVCLNEIKRSRPFFLGLLGDRYGWIPPHDKMRQMSVDYLDKSITDIAIECGFQSIRNFNRVFKNFADTTPGEFRKLKNKTDE